MGVRVRDRVRVRVRVRVRAGVRVGVRVRAELVGTGEQHGRRGARAKLPAGPSREEAVEERAGLRGRVELAHARREDGPRHAAREAERVVVEATPQRPQLHLG